MTEESPIFIVGRPRSGTTLLSAMLSSHPRIVIAPETHFLSTWVKAFKDTDLSHPDGLHYFWENFSKSIRFHHLGLESDLVFRKLKEVKAQDFRSVFEILLSMYAEKHGKLRWGEKTPNHEGYIGEIIGWFPRAKILYLLRDPRAVISSSLRMPWTHHQVFRHAITWRWSIVRQSGFHHEHLMIVQYEQLVKNPQDQLKAVCSFIEEDYIPEMYEEYSKAAEPLVVNQPWKEGVRDPIYLDAIDKWQTQLTDKEIATIEYLAGATMVQYGYSINPEIQLTILDKVMIFLRRAYRKIERTFEREKFNLS